MAHRIDYSKDGRRARITLDLSNASLEADVDASSSQFQELKNVALGRPGPLRKRGPIKKVTTGALATNTVGNKYMAVYRGTLRQLSSAAGAATYQMHLGMSPLANYYYDHGISGGTLIGAAATSSSAGALVSPERITTPTLIEDSVVHSGGPSSGLSVAKYGGGALATYTTGTATFTTGLATVTLSTPLSADQIVQAVGQYIGNTQDSLATAFTYRITAVDPGGSSLTIDRNYAGSRSGAASTFSMSSVARLYGTSGTLITSQAGVAAYAVGTAWQRLLLLRPYMTINGTNGYALNRLWWSGIADSTTEGTAPYTGIHAYSSSGYLDLPRDGGELIASASFGGAVAVFQRNLLTILYGQPTYSTTGSLDSSTRYRASVADPKWICETPYGIVYWDYLSGPMLWDGSGAPKRLSSKRTVSRLKEVCSETLTLPSLVGDLGPSVGYHNGNVVFLKTTGTGAVYNFETDSWAELSGDFYLFSLIPGRAEGLYASPLSAISYHTGDVVNVSSMLDEPESTDPEWDFNGAPVTMRFLTGNIGVPFTRIRPVRAYITYRAIDIGGSSPELQLNVRAGLPYTYSSVFSTASGDLPETQGSSSSAWGSATWGAFTWGDDAQLDAVTKVIEITGLDRADTVQVEVNQVRGGGRVDIYSVVIECDVEGDGG